MDRDAAARLAEQQPAQRVVGAERLHLLEDRRAGRRQHAADDDVADLAAGVAADDRERAARAHRYAASRSITCATVSGFSPVMRS